MYQDSEGKLWWKGNLHMHTTCSDGKKTPQEAMEIYQKAGYDFIALTDHWKPSSDGQYANMLTLPGVELDTMQGGCWHIVGIGMEREIQADRHMRGQELIDAIRAAGGEPILAHPAWSLDQPGDMAELTGLIGTEIYNSVSGYPYSARADSSHVLDLASKYGMRVPYMASDDTHYYAEELFGGFIYVQAQECSRNAILEALRAGRFYATQGPRIYGAVIQDGYFTVRCSKASAVIFYSASVWQADTVCRGQDVEEAKFRLKAHDRFVRAQIIDADGKSAWTSAYTVSPEDVI